MIQNFPCSRIIIIVCSSPALYLLSKRDAAYWIENFTHENHAQLSNFFSAAAALLLQKYYGKWPRSLLAAPSPFCIIYTSFYFRDALFAKQENLHFRAGDYFFNYDSFCRLFPSASVREEKWWWETPYFGVKALVKIWWLQRHMNKKRWRTVPKISDPNFHH